MSSPFAPRGLRLVGYLADSVLSYVASLGGAIFGGMVAGLMAGDPGATRLAEEAASRGYVLGWVFWGTACWFLNYGILQGLTGASVGKFLTGIRIVNLNGTPIGIRKSLSRTFCYVISTLPLYGGFIAIFFDPKNRCWHDLLCGTVVIRHDARYPEIAPVIPLSSDPAEKFPKAA